MSALWDALYIVLTIFLVLLIVRLVVSWITVFARDWRARGNTAMALEVVFTATDPPIKAVGRVVPPLRLSNFQLDVAFLVVFVAVLVLMDVVKSV